MSFASSVALLTDRVGTMLVWEAFRGARRFGEFKRRLAVSDAVLASRLSDLVSGGIFTTRRYQHNPPRDEYVLTEDAKELWKFGVGFDRWERRWGSPGWGRRVVHLPCDAPVDTRFGCACGEALTSRRDLDVDANLGEILAALVETPSPYRKVSWRESGPTVSSSAVYDVLGDRWSALVLLCGLCGIRRFNELQRSLGISSNLLTRRLNVLVAYSAIERVSTPGHAHHEYRVLPKGFDLAPLCVLGYHWAQRRLPTEQRRHFALRHAPHGHLLEPTWFCTACGDELRRGEVRYEFPSPGVVSWGRAATIEAGRQRAGR